MEPTANSFAPSFASSVSSFALKHPEEGDAIPGRLDLPVTIPSEVSITLSEKGFVVDRYGSVSFKQDSVSHPRRWPLYRKVFDSALICFLEYFMTTMSNTGATVSHHASAHFHISPTVAILCTVTVYLVGQAVGGLVFPPIAESFGHRTIYVSSTFGFAVLCLIIGAGHKHLIPVIAGRLLSGFLSAIPATVACGSIENMWDERARIFTMHAWISSAVLGLASGPSIATYISTSLGWPYIFYIAAGVTGICSILCLDQLRSAVGFKRPPSAHSKGVRADHDDTAYPSILHRAGLFWVSIMEATVYAVLYLFSEALTVVYGDGFQLSERTTSLIFLAFGIGIVPTFLPRKKDMVLANKQRRRGAQMEPEDKLFGFYVAAPVLAVGLWWFGATIPPLVEGVSPWASIASLLLIGYATVEFDNVLSGYLTDTYMSYAASANAPMSFLRATLSGVFPLFGHQMFDHLGSNVAVFILGGIATLFCGVAVWLKLKAGTLRMRSPFAEKTALSAHETKDLSP
ncbi:MFS general substrate transporter [Hortaea werneckii]|nr:MFS general substrate transporter [Hortaea werneckii]